MSVTTRTQRATNGNVSAAGTNWSFVAGTGGAGSGARNTGTGYDGLAGFWRSTWTTATTALSGGFSYLQTGLSASTAYTHSVYVRASKAQTVRLTAQYQNSSSSNVGSAVNGSNVTLVANEWARISVTATSGLAVDRVVLTAAATTGGSNWANGDTFDGDCLLIETGSVLDYFFDGSYADASGVDYAWTGTADASTSTATLYTPLLTLLQKSDDPCDRVEITIADLQPAENFVTLWRIADGKRRAVRSYRNVSIIGSDFVTDYEAPLGRLIEYELEILSGPGTGGPTDTATITVTATSGWIQDPLDPASAVRLHATDPLESGDLTLQDDALKQLEMPAEVSLMQILGDDEPMALMGQRMVQRGIPFSLATNAAQAATDIRNLIKQTPLLLVRPLPAWAAALPGLCYVAPPTPVELPVTEAWGGSLIKWKFETGLVKPPTMDLVIPVWTYQDWQDLWTTYQQAQTALSGDTYLQVKKSPSGA